MRIDGVPTSLADTPCVGVCSTTDERAHDQCVACGRFAHEVRDWSKFTDKRKKEINIRNWEDYPIRHRELTKGERELMVERISITRRLYGTDVAQKLRDLEEEIFNVGIRVKFILHEGVEEDEQEEAVSVEART